MATHVEHHPHLHRHDRERGRLDAYTLVPVGAAAGMAGGLMMAMWQMIVGAIARNPTALPGVHQSFWTPVEGIWSVIFGYPRFHSGFHAVPVLGGIAAHVMNSMMLGILGLWLATRLFGGRPTVYQAVAFGMMFGVVLEVVILNLLVNTILQTTVQTLYTSTPEWSWWVAHIMFGATVGFVGATLLRVVEH
jgi:hypothetical protein